MSLIFAHLRQCNASEEWTPFYLYFDCDCGFFFQWTHAAFLLLSDPTTSEASLVTRMTCRHFRCSGGFRGDYYAFVRNLCTLEIMHETLVLNGFFCVMVVRVFFIKKIRGILQPVYGDYFQEFGYMHAEQVGKK